MTRTELDAEVAVRRRSVSVDRVRQLVRVGDNLAAAAEDSGALTEVLADAATKLPADIVIVWTIEGYGGLHLSAIRHGDPLLQDALHARLLRDGAGLDDVLARVARSGRPLRVPTLAPDEARRLPSALREVIEEHAVSSVMVAPLWGRNLPVGVMALARTCGAVPFTRADLDFVLVLSRRTGMTLETARLIGQVREQAAVVDSVSDAVVALDRAGRITTWNAAAERIYAVGAGHAVGKRLEEILVLSEYEDGENAESVAASVHRTGSWRGRVRHTSAAGRVIDVESSVTARGDGRERNHGLVAVNRDLTEVLAAQAAAEAQQQFAHELLDAVDSRAAVIDRAGRVIAANSRWTAGVVERDRCRCGPVPEGADWLTGLTGVELPDVAAFAKEVDGVLRGERPLAHFECRCLDAGPERATAIEVALLHGLAGGAVVVQSDVTWRRRMHEEMAHRALHDDLTGLPNRAALLERLHASLQRLDGQHMLAVLFCDLDGFKDVNDGLGHAVGDQVLIAVARRLRQRCRSADVVARFGGDEFVVVLPVPDVSRARATAERLVEALTEPVAVGDAEVAPGASIGVTVIDKIPPGDDPVGTVLRDADTAMYHAKERGRGRHEIFDSSLREDISARLEYASALRRAIGNHELSLRYQTRRRCLDRSVTAVEALMRWANPRFGEVAPQIFVPVAERTGRIVELGSWALREALNETAKLAELAVAVNVSGRQLASSRLLETVEGALSASGVEPARLLLEIGEDALADDTAATHAVLAELRDLGVRIVLDGFGSGWSSMAQLRTAPLDVITIAREHVTDLPHDPGARAVVAAVLELGHGRGLSVVAEGVERADQLELLCELGCEEYQGFIDGPPGPLASVLA